MGAKEQAGAGTCRPQPCGTEGSIIHVDCASHRYPDGTLGIHDMCFSVCPREIVAICGANGSGKSTLLQHLNGLLLPSAGQVYVNGRPCPEVRRTIWRDVGLVFQRPDDQLFAPTVLDDVMFGPLNLGLSRAAAREAALEALRQVGAGGLADRLPGYLSGGEKRLVAIAGVLVMRPRVICLDEPTADLDEGHRSLVEQLIRRLRDQHGISIVIATHDLALAGRLADRLCLARDGSLIAEGRPREILYDLPALAEAGLAPPGVVEIYMDYCARAGLEPTERPLTVPELLDCISRQKSRLLPA